MYYFVIYKYSVLENTTSAEYWKVSEKWKRDDFCANLPTAYPVLKTDIPNDCNVKLAANHRKSWSGRFVFPAE